MRRKPRIERTRIGRVACEAISYSNFRRSFTIHSRGLTIRSEIGIPSTAPWIISSFLAADFTRAGIKTDLKASLEKSLSGGDFVVRAGV